ncbi:AAA family ATPase [Cryobacterium sp. 10I5]|uniref:AAA family ATPase n=1 Tax=Cryobacterium sp. 10I5 TaxID=3048581 RepID=UPI002B230B51|nr:AAA family ATPase [Cryobacterium sp. 10I5]MEB0265067.1 AAA family ATPase [Cryobacterium sp. 10I5]
MPPFQQGIREYFGADECPDRSWSYLHATDQAWIRRIALAGGEDPGIIGYSEMQDLRPDDRRRRIRQLEDWYKAWPYVRTEQVKNIERHLAALPEPRPQLDDELLDVPFITGPPGTGKTALLKRAAVEALCRAAWDRRLEMEDSPHLSNRLVEPDWRPVIYHSTDGNPIVKTFFTHLCHEIGAPEGSDPQVAFQKAVIRHGVQTVFIDEVQMINFDGQYGMYLHNALKALQNMNVRVVLAGHNVRSMLVQRKTSAQNATQFQSIARWAFQDLERYPHETKPQIDEWRKLLKKLESHVRLAGHKHNDPVFSTEFEEHLWVSTLGYINSLASLITGASLTASRTRSQRITAEIIDAVRLNERVQQGRAHRLRNWRAGLFEWSTRAQESP